MSASKPKNKTELIRLNTIIKDATFHSRARNYRAGPTVCALHQTQVFPGSLHSLRVVD